MGFDISYHPVDERVVRERIIPFITGQASLDDLVREAVRIGRTRFRANAWGLGVTELDDKAPASFDPTLHVWGRPFFITVDDPAAIGDVIDRYLRAENDAAVDTIAREMLRALDPALIGKVEPDTSGTLPSDAESARGVIAHLELLRKAYKNLESGEPVELPGGEEAEPGELIAREVPWVSLAFACQLRPGWMDRGHVWPTHVFETAGIDATDLFEPPRLFLGPIAEIDDLDFFLEPTIVENNMVGGVVASPKVPELRKRLESNEKTLIAALIEDAEGDDEGLGVSFKKMMEAVRDAERRGMAFAEASEIYSGFEGIMN